MGLSLQCQGEGASPGRLLHPGGGTLQLVSWLWVGALAGFCMCIKFFKS